MTPEEIKNTDFETFFQAVPQMKEVHHIKATGQEIADRIIVINDGLVEKSGKGEEVIPELLYKSSMCQKLNRD